MRIRHNVRLRDYCTMKLGGTARYFVEITKPDETHEAMDFAREHNLRHFILGGGANIVFLDEGFDGLVIKNSISGFSVTNEDSETKTLTIGAGENWDEVVERTCDMQLSGIETLSGIPGTVGGAPVQNIGAYGQELADTFVELEAYDTATKEFVHLNKSACKFGYRTSIFKSTGIGRYVIISITLRLKHSVISPPFYTSLQRYLDEHNISDYRPANIRKAVLEIRKSKLPDPSLIANSGSFFQNPIVDRAIFDEISTRFPNMPFYPVGSKQIKIPAGWLIEHAGGKKLRTKHFSTYNLHALVITHDGKGTAKELKEFIKLIQSRVKQEFKIHLYPEPQLIT